MMLEKSSYRVFDRMPLRTMRDEYTGASKGQVKFLNKMGADARPALAELSLRLADEDCDVRRAARKAIQSIGFNETCLPGIQKAFASRSWSIRRDTARLLGYCGPAAESALPHVLGLFSDSDSDVRKAAEYAADRIRGIPVNEKRTAGLCIGIPGVVLASGGVIASSVLTGLGMLSPSIGTLLIIFSSLCVLGSAGFLVWAMISVPTPKQ